jgi:hypothetical protein
MDDSCFVSCNERFQSSIRKPKFPREEERNNSGALNRLVREDGSALFVRAQPDLSYINSTLCADQQHELEDSNRTVILYNVPAVTPLKRVKNETPVKSESSSE